MFFVYKCLSFLQVTLIVFMKYLISMLFLAQPSKVLMNNIRKIKVFISTLKDIKIFSAGLAFYIFLDTISRT